MGRGFRAAAAGLALALAGCNLGGDVPAERLPRFAEFQAAPRVGALVGALYAAGLNAAELERRAYDINVLEFFEFRLLTGGIATGTTIQSYVNTCVDGKPLPAIHAALARAGVPAAQNVSTARTPSGEASR